MDPQRFRKIEQLYHAALDCDPAGRRAFLAEACGTDEELLREVESLLDRPLLHSTITSLAPGARLGPYEVGLRLGAGGMGEVFRAVDTRLGRAVALKIARKEFGSRFEREARAIAQLNHPHICTLFDVGPNYLVMELVEGETLAALLKKGPLPVDLVLQYGVQMADALAVAHAKGIVHRDLKPSNVMVAGNGVKLLDFGLAKMAAPGEDLTNTLSNVMVGTPAYMAPEQFEGKEATPQTDLFALGLILYEMISGRVPCPGASLGSMLASNAEIQMRAPSQLRRGTPPKLDLMILRLLERSPQRRIQTAQEVLEQLRELRQPARKNVPLYAAALLGMVLVAAAGWWVAGRRESNLTAISEFVRLTNFPDSVHSPALSKDGRMLAFLRGPIGFLEGAQQIYLKPLPDGQPLALTQDTAYKMAPAFSPDGSRIVYSSGNWSSFSVPISGGKPELTMTNAAALRWIGPNQILFSELRDGFHMGLVTASGSRADPRTVYFPESSQGMVHFSELSPDGKSVLAVEMVNAIWQPCRLVPFSGSGAGRQVGPPASLCTAATWSPDGQWMYFAAEVAGETHLWRQRFPDGPPEQLTAGVNQEWTVAADPDGRSLIAAVGNRQSTVWFHDAKGDRPVSVEGYAFRPLLSPDGSHVYYLVRKSARGSIWSGELWSVDIDSGVSRHLLPEFLVQHYRVSRDNRTIVFDALDQSGRSKVWIASPDGSRPPRKVTTENDAEDAHPFLGESGNIYLVRSSGNQRSLLRISPDGAATERLRDVSGQYPVNLSPDEQWIAFWEGGRGAILYPVNGGPARDLCRCNAGPIFQDSSRVAWSGDGKFLVVNSGGSMSGLGTVAIPWRGADALRPGPLPVGPDLLRQPGAIHLSEISVAPGPTMATYAFARTAEQSNLYRLRLK